jgi:hypothetical protein
MNVLKEVKSYMRWFGWEHGGDPQSVKRDVAGRVIARHGDATWVADVEKACAVIDRIHKRACGEQESR